MDEAKRRAAFRGIALLIKEKIEERNRNESIGKDSVCNNAADSNSVCVGRGTV